MLKSVSNISLFLYRYIKDVYLMGFSRYISRRNGRDSRNKEDFIQRYQLFYNRKNQDHNVTVLMQLSGLISQT